MLTQSTNQSHSVCEWSAVEYTGSGWSILTQTARLALAELWKTTAGDAIQVVKDFL
jgi:hypothetical protein